MSPRLSSGLSHTIVLENLGALNLADYEPGQQDAIRSVICGRLLATAEADFPPDLPSRAKAIEHMRELVALTCPG
jgi:hypothetical protein